MSLMTKDDFFKSILAVLALIFWVITLTIIVHINNQDQTTTLQMECIKNGGSWNEGCQIPNKKQ